METLSDLNKQKKQIRASGMTSTEKKKRLRKIEDRENLIKKKFNKKFNEKTSDL